MPETDTPHKNPRSYASNVSLTFFGVSVLPVNLLPAKEPDPKELRVVCATCEDATPLEQKYLCTADPTHGPFALNEAHRAIDVNGTLKKVTDEERENLVFTELPAGEAQVRVFDAHDIESTTFPTDSIYRIQPRSNADIYSMFCDLVADPHLAFVCELALRGRAKMYRIIARDGMLTLVGLLRPGTIRDIRVEHGEYDAELLGRLRTFAADQAETFETSEWAEKSFERVAELREAKSSGTTAPAPVVVKAKVADPTAGLKALLDAAPAKAKPARKRAAKKAAAKKVA